jgi:hypothetical protein
MNTTTRRADKIVSLDSYVQGLVETLADRLDLNRRLRRPRASHRSHAEAISEAAERWAFDYDDDPVDDDEASR